MLKKEENLQVSKNRYKKLFEKMNQGFALLELVTDSRNKPFNIKILDVNPAFSALLDIEARQVLNRHVTEAFPSMADKQGERVRRYSKVAISGEELISEEYVPDIDKWFLVHAYYAEKMQFVVIFTDITEKKMLEKTNKASENKFRALVEQSLTGIYIFDRDKFIYVNKRFCEIFGYSEEEILTTLRPTDVVQERDHDNANELINKRLDGELDHAHYIAQGKHKYGKPLWIEIYGSRIVLNNEDVITGTVLDITERFESQASIKESENKFRAAFEQSPNGMCLTSFDGVMLQVNKPLCEILEYTKQDLEGKHFNQITHPEDITVGLDFIGRISSGELEKGSFQKRYLTKNGKVIWAEVQSAIVRDAEDKATHFITHIEDITERKQAEEDLKFSEERFAKAFNLGPTGITITRVADGKFMDVNQSFLELFGYSREEVIGKTSTDLKMWTTEERRKIIEAQVREGGLQSTELTARSKSGKAVHVLFSSNPIQLQNEDCLITSIIDVSEKKKVETELIESEHKFRTLFEQASVGVAIIDTATGRFKSVNSRQCEIMGYSKKELLQSDFISVTHPDDLAEDLRNMERLKNEEIEYFIMEKRYLQKNGSTVWVRLNVSPLWKNKEPQNFHVAICEDITDRKIAEKTLSESEIRYRSLFENMNAGFVLFEVVQNDRGTPVDLIILAANKGFESTTGLNLRNSAGKRLSLALPGIEQDEADWIGTYSKIAQTGEPQQFEQYSELLDTYYSISAFSPGSKLCAVTFTDITDRKKAEKEVKELNESLEIKVEQRTLDLEMANSELEAFTYSVSHDLRAPLRAIDGFSKFLYEDFGKELNDEGKRLIKVIRNNTAMMDQLINDLLKLSQITKNQIYLSKVNMTKLVQSIIDKAVSEKDKRCFEFKIKELPEVPGDYNLLYLVWVNLISNSIKYSGPARTKKIIINCSSEKDFHTFSVKDFGVGFNPSYKAKLFGIFERLHSMEEFEGTGVGLAIVQRIIHRHRGKVWAESEVNKGATFYFSLPKNINHGV